MGKINLKQINKKKIIIVGFLLLSTLGMTIIYYHINKYEEYIYESYDGNKYEFEYNKRIWEKIEVGEIKDEGGGIVTSDLTIKGKDSLKISIYLQNKDYIYGEYAFKPWGEPRISKLKSRVIYSFFDKKILNKDVLIYCNDTVDCQFYEKREDGLYWRYEENLFNYDIAYVSIYLEDHQPTEKEIEEVIELIEDIHNAKEIN